MRDNMGGYLDTKNAYIGVYVLLGLKISRQWRLIGNEHGK